MTTPTQDAGAILHGLLSQFKGDVLSSAKGILGTFFTNITAQPTETNVIAQALAVVATAPLQIPGLESTAIAQFGTAGTQLLTLIPPPATP